MRFWKKSQKAPESKVEMLVSVGGDLVAGQSYVLTPELADILIYKGYAQGTFAGTSMKPAPPGAEDQRVVING